MGIFNGGNTPYYLSMDFSHLPVLVSVASVAHVAEEIARQPIMVLKILEEIVDAGVVSALNKIQQKRDEMSCAYGLMIHIGLTTPYLLLMKSSAGKTTAGPPILVVISLMLV